MTAGVVTFSNQIGANGAAIARAVADKLGYRYYDWEVIAQAATEAGVPPAELALASEQRSAGFIERFMRHLIEASAEEDIARPAMPRPSILRSDEYRQFIEHVVAELGARGDAVIVGHASQAVLKDKPGVLKVLLFGSVKQRAERVAANQGLTADEAKQLVEQSDKQRLEFFKRVYHLDWLDARAYDVALNTDRLSTELARDMIVACAREVP